MSDRLHEIIAEVGMIHKTILETNKIKDSDYILEYIEDYEEDVKEHYLVLLLQYYFQTNDLDNFKKIVIFGYKFDLRMNDIKEAFINIKSNEDNVIGFLEDNVVFFKDTDYKQSLERMYKYYMDNEELQSVLEETIELIKRNRYICAFAYKHQDEDYAKFFLNEELLESLKRDLPYLL